MNNIAFSDQILSWIPVVESTTATASETNIYEYTSWSSEPIRWQVRIPDEPSTNQPEPQSKNIHPSESLLEIVDNVLNSGGE